MVIRVLWIVMAVLGQALAMDGAAAGLVRKKRCTRRARPAAARGEKQRIAAGCVQMTRTARFRLGGSAQRPARIAQWQRNRKQRMGRFDPDQGIFRGIPTRSRPAGHPAPGVERLDSPGNGL